MLLYSGGWPIQAFFWLEWGCSPSALRISRYPASSKEVLKSSAKADHSFLFLELTTSSLPDGRFFHCRGFYAGSVGGRGGCTARQENGHTKADTGLAWPPLADPMRRLFALGCGACGGARRKVSPQERLHAGPPVVPAPPEVCRPARWTGSAESCSRKPGRRHERYR